MSVKKKASAYLVVAKDTYGNPRVDGLRKEKPSLKSGQFAVKIVLALDSALFEQLIPMIEAEISAPDVILPTVEVVEAEEEAE